MVNCPYCKFPLSPETIPPLTFSARQRIVYDAVVRSGPLGVKWDELLPGRSNITIRTCIYSINKIIFPKRIRSRGGVYYLTEEATCELPESLPKT